MAVREKPIQSLLFMMSSQSSEMKEDPLQAGRDRETSVRRTRWPMAKPGVLIRSKKCALTLLPGCRAPVRKKRAPSWWLRDIPFS
jgi:hypothetical protein